MVAKNFLDTSVARPLLLGTQTFRAALSTRIGSGTRYISPFVEMEFNRSFLCSLIEFYFLLKLPTVRSVEDALTLASNEFKLSKLKATIQLAAKLFATRQIAIDSTAAKPKALYALAEVIIRIHSRFHQDFVNTGKDSTRCARAAIRFIARLENVEGGFRHFLDAFSNTADCRSRCSIDEFFVKRHVKHTTECVEMANALKSSKETNGFKKIATNLESIMSSRGEDCSCRMCGNVGDAVIVLDADRGIPVHHIDQSFVQLCSLAKQPHIQHPSETSVVKTQAV